MSDLVSTLFLDVIASLKFRFENECVNKYVTIKANKEYIAKHGTYIEAH